MILYFVRHGEPIYNPDSLTPLGHEQAKALSKRFLVHGLDRVYVSSSIRAQQTAQPTCDLLRITPTICDWAHEDKAYADFHAKDENGKEGWILDSAPMLEKFSDPEVLKLRNKWYTHPYFADTGYEAGVNRINTEVDKLMEELGYRHDRETGRYYQIGEPPKRVAMFAHYGFGMAFLSSVLDIPYNEFLPRFNIGLTGMTAILFYHHKNGMVIPQVVQHAGDGHLYREGLLKTNF
ncbi:MAG: histidine phosphatase family protein [Clostridia bacterium]|nr:histidine phosphatase family protein [Clostridia bacterium]